MSTKYQMADATTTKLMNQVMLKSHTDLNEAKVKIDVQFAIGDEGAPSVKVSGYDTFGKVIRFSVDKRVGGSGDARLIIDKTVWEKAEADERNAIMDHLLHRLEVRKDEKGNVIPDTANRPKLNLRKYDMRLAGYSEVLERNGKDAYEYHAMKVLKERYGQLLMWAEDPKAAA